MGKKIILITALILLTNIILVSATAEDFFDKTIDLTKAKIPSKIIFGFETTSLSNENLIILIDIWILLLLILQSILKQIEIFGKNNSWVIAIIINLLIGTSGAFIRISDYLTNSFEISFLKELTALKLLLIVLASITVYILVNIFGDKIKKGIELEKIKEEGRKANIGKKLLEIESDSLKD